MAKLERIYTIPLSGAFDAPRNKRVPKAVKIVKGFVSKHMKADGQRILISEALNKYLWRGSIQKPPRKMKVRVIKEEETITAYLVDEKIEEKKVEKKEEKAQEKKEEKPKEAGKEKPKEEKPKEVKKPEEKKEEKPAPKAEEKEQDKK